MSRFISFTFLIGLLTFISACSESTFEEETEAEGYEYYPIALGSEWIYQVDSVVYQSGGAEILTSTSFVKEEITALFEEGDQSYVLTRSSRKSEDSPWLVSDVYTIERDEDRAYRTENNRRFIKLTFPIRDGKTWDGNIYFDAFETVDVFGNQFPVYEGWEYEMSVEEQPVDVAGQSYSDVITVNHVDRDDKLSWSKSYEQYAKDIGLIYRAHLYLDTNQLQSTEPWEDKAEAGFTLEQRLISFKK